MSQVSDCTQDTDINGSSVGNDFNKTSDDQTLSGRAIPGPAAVLGASVGMLIIALGLFGNFLVILAVWKSRPLRKASNLFVVSLAVCDLFQTACVHPLYIFTYVMGQWTLGGKACLYALYVGNLATLESILHVSTIAFYRYAILLHPRKARHLQKPRAVVFLLCLIYLLPFLIVVVPSAHRLMPHTQMNRDLVFNHRIMFCARATRASQAFSPAGIIKKSAFLGIAALFLCYCYLRIYVKVRQSGRLVNGTNSTFSPVRLRREVTLLKTIIAVFVAFVASYLPVTVLYAVDGERRQPYALYVFTVMLLWASSSVNWMIYGLMNHQYLQAYQHVLCGHVTYASSGVAEPPPTSPMAKAYRAQTSSHRTPDESQPVRQNGYSTLEMSASMYS